MKIRRFTAAAAMVAASALVLTACGGGASDTPTDGATGGETQTDDSGIVNESALSIGWNQPFYEYNEASATGNATANSIVKYLMNSGFQYYNPDLELVKDESFGTFEKTSDDPLTVKYTLSDTAKWSDGTPVDAADLVMAWGAGNSRFNTFEDAEVEYDDEGNITNQAEIDKNVFFNATGAALTLIEEFPEISDDGKSATFVYTKPYGDWELALGVGVPAHVVAGHALDIADAQEAKDALMKAFKDDDKDALSKISKFWNEGFQFGDALPDDESLYLSNGAYLLTELRDKQYVTLEANPDFEGKNKASIQKITIRYSEKPEQQVLALQNGDVDLISPQATADILLSLEGSGDQFTTITGIEGTYEHVDLVFDNGGPFDPTTYGGDADKALQVRQAFLKLVPRQEIVDKLIVPLNPDAAIRNSFTVLPGSEVPNYDEIVKANGMEQYDTVDLEGAKELLNKAGVSTPIDVRFLYGKSNERRAQEYALIAESVGQDNLFNLIDGGDDLWGSMLDDNSKYDASLFGWQSTSTAVTESDANYRTGGQNNFGGYSNADVDGWYDELQVATEDSQHQELLDKIEAQLVKDAFGVTLWQFPSVTAYNNKLQGVEPITINPTIFYGFWNWTLEG